MVVDGLVVGEIGAGLLIRSFAKILSIDRGFVTENVLTADIPLDGERYDFAHALVRHTLYERLSPSRRARLHSVVT